MSIQKTLSFTIYCATSAAFAQEAVDFAADTVNYHDNGAVVEAAGDVEISNTERSVRADNVTYDRDKKSITATGDILYKDTSNVSVYMDNLSIAETLDTAELNDIIMTIGDHGPLLYAEKAEKPNAQTYVMKDVNYSPCRDCVDKRKPDAETLKDEKQRLCSEKPTDNDKKRSEDLPWRIRADQVTYHMDQGKVVYDDAYLDIYGVPVIYLPYFSHAAGQQRGQTGLLPPQFGRSTNRGEEVTLGFYNHIDPQTDYTFRARHMTQRGTQLMAEHRRMTDRFYTEIKGSVIEDDLTSSLRSHIETKTEYVFNKGFRAGINGRLVSDQTYLDDFFNETDSYLPTTVYVEKADRNFYGSISGTWYQDLRSEMQEEQTAHVLPSFTVSKMFETDDDGGRLTLSSNLLTIHRTEGDRYRRFVNDITFSKPWTLRGGHLIEATANARADVYHVENATETGFESRGLAQASLMWSRPMTSADGYHTITPKAMLVAAPRGGNPDDIPNEDSVAYELDTNNLFDTNRYAGDDRVESGTRVIYGIDNYWGDAGHDDYRIFLGQSYRFHDDSTMPDTSGTRTKASDFVSLVSMSPTPWFELSNHARFDNADFTTRRMDSTVRIGDNDATNMTATYTFLEGGAEELNISARYDITDSISFRAQNRRDLTDGGKTLTSEMQAIYTHNCYRLGLTARRRGFENDTVPPATEFMFNIELLSLGKDND